MSKDWNINERSVLIALVCVVLAMAAASELDSKKMFVSLDSKLPNDVSGASFCSYLQNAIRQFDYVNCVKDGGIAGAGERIALSSGNFPADGIDFLDYECRYMFSHHCREADFKEAVLMTDPKIVVTIPMEFSERFGEPHEWLLDNDFIISPMYYNEVYDDISEFKTKLMDERTEVQMHRGIICPSLWKADVDYYQRLEFVQQNFDCWVVWEVVKDGT